MTGRVRIGVTALTVAALLGGCGGGGDSRDEASGSASGSGEHGGHGGENKADFARSEADTVVNATMRDYVFGGIPQAIRGPKVLFEVKNDGPRQHEFLVTHDDGEEAAGIEPFEAGRTETLAAELPPGTYKLTCLVQEGDKTHAALGMESTFTVTVE